MIKAMRYLVPQPDRAEGLSRRRFLKVLSLGTAGFLVGCSASPPPTPSRSPRAEGTPLESGSASSDALADLNAFVRVGSDDTVTVVIKHAEFGQGVTTGLTTIVAEELDARWEQMKWEFAPADASKYANTSFGIQGTGGSSSIANSWAQLRQSGAAAKAMLVAMLVAAAAESWGVKAEEIIASEGRLSHPGGK